MADWSYTHNQSVSTKVTHTRTCSTQFKGMGIADVMMRHVNANVKLNGRQCGGSQVIV